MLNQLQRGNEPELLRCHHSVFLRRPQVHEQWRQAKTSAATASCSRRSKSASQPTSGMEAKSSANGRRCGVSKTAARMARCSASALWPWAPACFLRAFTSASSTPRTSRSATSNPYLLADGGISDLTQTSDALFAQRDQLPHHREARGENLISLLHISRVITDCQHWRLERQSCSLLPLMPQLQ